MDNYSIHYVEHNTPLLVLSGLLDSTEPINLSQGAGQAATHITCPIPPVDTPLAKTLLRCFLATSKSGIWSGRPGRTPNNLRGQNPVFRVKAVGRDYVLPSRKASLPLSSPPTSPASEGLAVRTLHSPLSPLSPESPLFPDGVITPLWMRKHQDIIPSVFIPCFELYTDTTDSNAQKHKDYELIKGINDLKRHFGSTSANIIGLGSHNETSMRRSRFAVIILAEKSILHFPDLEERLGVIRRSTNLDANTTLFFLPSPSTSIEVQAFVRNVQLRLFGTALEYYRDLFKHSRRKKKSPIPLPTVAPTAASTTLSDAGWGIRYEIKLGVFAEFRQEMDIAMRSYEIAYEALLEDIFSTTNSWSGRWAEARLLADMLSIRVLRCLLWIESWTTAVRRWEYHIIKMRDLVDAKGKGTQTYGFAAWLTTWYRAFAELLQTADLPMFATVAPGSPNSLVPSLVPNPNMQIYAQPEKNIQSMDKISPQEYLHHPGFYYLSAANYAAERHARVLRYTESEPFDDYLCFSPNDELTKVNHYEYQINLFELAKREFFRRGQKRMGDMMSHNMARLMMEKGDNSDWAVASVLLQELAQTYRQEGWIALLEEVLWMLARCTRSSGDGAQQVVVEFELLSSKFRRKEGLSYDLLKCLSGPQSREPKPTITLREKDVIPFLSVSYTFKTPEACVGDAVVSQLVMSSNAHKDSAPIIWSSIKVTFEGSAKTILLTHDPCAEPTQPKSSYVQFLDLKGKLQEQAFDTDASQPSSMSPKSFLTVLADLSLYPSETKVIELSNISREAGEARAMAATFEIVTNSFQLEYLVILQQDDEGWTDELGIGGSVGSGSRKRGKGEITPSGGNAAWWIQDRSGKLRRRPVRSEEPTALKILPKPPKMEVKFNNIRTPAFINEIIDISLEICNDEEEDAQASLGVQIMGYPEGEEPSITWLSSDRHFLASPPLHSLGRIPATIHIPSRFTFPTYSRPIDIVIEITVHYHLLSDPETPISKSMSVNVPIVSPFSLIHEWAPRVHTDKWPSYFDTNEDIFMPDAEGKVRPMGLMQRWCLTVLLTNLEAGSETVERTTGIEGTSLVVDGWELQMVNIGDALQCNPLEPIVEGQGIVMNSSKSTAVQFLIDIRRMTFEDRRPAFLESILHLKWRRMDSNQSSLNTTKIPIPRLPISGSEPRVLAVAKKAPIPPYHVHLEYSIENPTNYFLTFNIIMEANEAFAFSGPKQYALQLAPLSKVDIRYHVWPFVRNAWIRPVLRVEDRYFNKILSCMSAGSRGTMKMDKEKGVMVWVGGWDEGGNEVGDTETEGGGN